MKFLPATLFILLFSLFAVTAPLNAQNLDSLYTIWDDDAQTDSVRAQAYKQYIWNGFLFNKPDTAFILAEALVAFAQEKQSPSAKSSAYSLQAISFAMKSDYPKALEYYNRSLEIDEEIGNRKGISSTLSNMGSVYRNQGNYPQALEYGKRGLKIQEEIGDKNVIGITLNNIGNMYQSQGDYPQALEYYTRSLKIRDEIGDKKGISDALGNIGIVHHKQGNYAQALDYFKRNLKGAEEIGDEQGISTSLSNLGMVYQQQGDYPKALEYYTRSLKSDEAIGDVKGIAISINNIGNIHQSQDNYAQALEYYTRSLKITEEIGDKQGTAATLANMGITYSAQGEHSRSITECLRSLKVSEEIGAVPQQKKACECLYNTYKAMGKGNDALRYHEQMIVLKDSIFNEKNTRKLTRLELQYEFDKKEATTKLKQERKDAIAAEELKRHKLIRNSFMGGFGVMLLFAIVFLYQRNKIKKGKKQSDELLLNILPAEVAKELKTTGETEAKSYDTASILFTDFKDFTQTSANLNAQNLVAELNICFKAFDGIMEKNGIEKIKTIGDAYMAASGLPIPSHNSVKNSVLAAIEMQGFISNRKAEMDAKNLPAFEMRVGIHTGPIVAGIVGVKKFQYDIWGDAVNTASRMESNGDVGKVNISQTTYELIKDDPYFDFESRGKIEVKGKGEMEMWFVSYRIDS